MLPYTLIRLRVYPARPSPQKTDRLPVLVYLSIEL